MVSSMSDLSTLTEELNKLARSQIQLMSLIKNKSKNKREEDLVDADYEDTIHLRFVGGGCLVLFGDEEYDEAVAQIENELKPLKEYLKQEIYDICADNARINNVTQIEKMRDYANWLDKSNGSFCDKKSSDTAEGDETVKMEFLERWEFYLPFSMKKEAEHVRNTIQAIINKYASPYKKDLIAGIKALIDAD